jgi:prevent-host-death family protein
MTKFINIYDAKTRLSQLVDSAARGEDVVIARAGRPMARLVAFNLTPTVRKSGRLRGRIRIGRNFNSPLPDDLFAAGDE